MRDLKFFVKKYSSVDDWLLSSRLVLDSLGGGRRFGVECCDGFLWFYEFRVDDVRGVDDLVCRTRIGKGSGDFEEYFMGLGFRVVLPVDHVLFE
ncbi:MAG: hypothetical protein IJF83_03020 [Methanobrevibacter sp.]|nr:hypothetical protein [Methanobrevibacter sp.]